MGQHIVLVINNIPGLFLKRHGSHPAGAKWSIENVPEVLIEKAKAKETGRDAKGRIVPICSFLTADGSIVGIEQAYIPRFNIGKAPPPVVEFQSKKSRSAPTPEPEPELEENDEEIKSESEEENNESNSTEEEEESESASSEDETSEDSSTKKKKKKLKRIGQ